MPIIFLTRERPDESIVKALHLGAASYVPRSRIARSVEDTVERVLSLCEKAVIGTRLLDTMTESSMVFELPGDPSLFSDVIHYLLEQIDHFALRGSLDRISIGVAIQEALLNAWVHGNLEIESSSRKEDFDAFDRLIEERRRTAQFSNRKVTVRSKFNASEGRIEIRDEGRGFDVSTVPDPRLPENVRRPSGRGLFLMRQFFDDVHYNDGEWVKGDSYTPNVNPSNLAESVGEYARADKKQAEDAIQAARAAFAGWAQGGIQARSDALDVIGSEILERREELGTPPRARRGKTAQGRHR